MNSTAKQRQSTGIYANNGKHFFKHFFSTPSHEGKSEVNL
jgi:hypothetical protein